MNSKVESESCSSNSECFEVSKSTTSKGNLALRRDVLNKAVLRILKKFFKETYKNTLGNSQRRNKTKAAFKQFKENIGPMAEKYFRQCPEIESEKYSTLELDELMGRIVNSSLYSKMPKTFKSDETECIKSFIRLLDECCKNYTHRKCDALLHSKYFKVLLLSFLNNIDEKYLVDIEKNKNIDVYYDAITKMLFDIESFN